MLVMSPWTTSVLLWIGGGVVGAAVAKQHRVAGAALGAILVGVIGDKMIERHHPMYTGPRTAEDYRFVCAALQKTRG